MSNILDYLVWRGDLPFSKNRINEVDKLILMRLSYMPFDEIKFCNSDKITIEELMVKLSNVSVDKYIWPDDKKLIILLGTSVRFKDLIVSDYIEIIDKSLEKQFAAIVISFPDSKDKIISYRGTDMSLTGWKEDFNMFFKNNIPSQIEGINYLNNISNRYIDSTLSLIGHSKGGNIAIYASIYCNDLVKYKIKEIVTADAPGLTEEVINDEKYNDIKNKIKTFIPQTSIVGRLLETRNDYIIVQSNGKGFMQHDIYSWEIGPTFLIQIKDASKESDFANNIIKKYFAQTSPADREKFINIVYEILNSLNIETVTDIPKVLLKNTNKVLKKYKNISEEDKKQLENMMNCFKDIIVDNIKLEFTKNNKSKDIKKLPKKEEKNKNKNNKLFKKL